LPIFGEFIPGSLHNILFGLQYQNRTLTKGIVDGVSTKNIYRGVGFSAVVRSILRELAILIDRNPLQIQGPRLTAGLAAGAVSGGGQLANVCGRYDRLPS
jgi:hypothetical protein